MRLPQSILTWVRLRASALAAASFLFLQIIRLARLARMPTDRLVGFVPDDAFYYLVLARNFSRLDRWTFDQISPATGFHLLWAYGIAAVYWLRPEIGFRAMFVLLASVSALLLTLAVYLVCRVVALRFGPFAILGAMVIFLTAPSLHLANYLMEAPLVLCFCAATLFVVSAGRTSRKHFALAGLFGFLGMISRSDFGLFPLVLTIAAFLFRAPYRRLAATVLLGSIVGLSGVVAHTLLVSGHLYQGSTRAKRKWSIASGDLRRYSVNFAAQPLYPHNYVYPVRRRRDALMVGGLCGLGVLCGLTRKKPGNIAMIVGMSLTPIGYIMLYRYDSAALQPWYSANFLVPYSLAMAAIFSVSNRTWHVLAAMAGAVWCLHGFRLSLTPVWPAQKGFYEAALYVHDHPQDGPVAAWNAGILNFFSHSSRVVNIDGLVNDDADDAILADHLPQYLRAHKVATLIDDKMMLTIPAYRSRGGYPGETLTGCLRSVQPIWSDPRENNPGDHVVRATLDLDCLQ